MENQINIGDQNAQQIGKNPINQPAVSPEKPKLNYLVIAGIILACFIVFGFGGYYLGKQSLNPGSNSSGIQDSTGTTTNSEANSPTSSPIPTNSEARPRTNNLTAWRHSTGYWLLNLPSSWSAASFDSGPFSQIKVYAEPVSWEDSQSGKDLSNVEVMTINIALSDKEFTSNNVFIWKKENGVLKSNTLILESQKGPLSFSISYPKNTNYKDQINVVLDSLNFKASSEELSKEKQIP